MDWYDIVLEAFCRIEFYGVYNPLDITCASVFS